MPDSETVQAGSGASLLFAPSAVRTRGAKVQVDVAAESHFAGRLVFRWQLLGRTDSDRPALAWVSPSADGWPITADLADGGHMSWQLDVVPNRPSSGTYLLQTNLEFDTPNPVVVTVNDLTVIVPDTVPRRLLKWLGRYWYVPSIVVVVLVLAIVGWWVLFGRFVEVPNLVGYDEPTAVAIAGDFDLDVSTNREFFDGFPNGTVARQLPAGQTRVERGHKLTLSVTASATIPNVAGMTRSDAEDLLQAAGLTHVYRAVDSMATYGTIIGSDPDAGSLVPRGSQVDILVASIDFIQLSSKQLTVARNVIERRGLEVRPYYYDIGGRIVDAEKGICHDSSRGITGPCIAVAFGGPQGGVVDVGVVTDT